MRLVRDINFFKPYKNKGGNQQNFYKAIIILLVVIIIGSFSVNTAKIILLNKQIEVYNNKLEQDDIKKKVKIVETTNREREALKRYKLGLNTVLTSIETRNIVSNVILDQISSTLPSKVSFKSMNINHEIVTIQGVTTDRQSIGEIQYNLKSLVSIEDVYVEKIDGSESLEGEYTFNLKCYLNGGGN